MIVPGVLLRSTVLLGAFTLVLLSKLNRLAHMRFRQAATAVCLLSMLVLTGSSQRHSLRSSPCPDLAALRATAYSLYQQGSLQQAESLYRRCFQLAESCGDRRTAFRCLNSTGGVLFAMFQYREAVDAFLKARKMAQQLGDPEFLAAVATNLSSLYLQNQELSAGALAADQALEALARVPTTRLGSLLKAQAAVLHSRKGNHEAAGLLFEQALAEADARADDASLALAAEQLGFELLRRNQADRAGDVLLRAYRLRRLKRLPDLAYSYYGLGLWRLAVNDAVGARRLFDRAFGLLSERPAALPLWRLHYGRGRAWMLEGRWAEALADFEAALEGVRDFRLELLPSDSVWTQAGAETGGIYSGLIQAAGNLFELTGEKRYSRLAFEAAEESRAAAFRNLLAASGQWRQRLPRQYWETLAVLRRMESGSFSRSDAAAVGEKERLQARLVEMEIEAGLDFLKFKSELRERSAGLVEAVQARLEPDEVLLSFRLDDPASFLWIVTRQGFRMRRLPSKAVLEPRLRLFRWQVERGERDALEQGKQIYEELFGSSPEVRSKRHWLLALDGELFRTPMAALVEPDAQGNPEYAGCRHAQRIVPVVLPTASRQPLQFSKTFLGVADPVYNLADPRFRGAAGEFWMAGLFPLPSPLRPGRNLELPRLPAGAEEVQACRAAWSSDWGRTIVLSGERANTAELNRAAAGGADVVHFATHFVAPEGEDSGARIVLSLDAAGRPELLGATEIAKTQAPVGLVVLSGCASGGAAVLPAEGLMGLSRAWMLAGARTVLATLWPLPDDHGALLVSFYKHLAGARPHLDGRAAAEALRLAREQVPKTGGYGSSPSGWGAYFLAGKE